MPFTLYIAPFICTFWLPIRQNSVSRVGHCLRLLVQLMPSNVILPLKDKRKKKTCGKTANFAESATIAPHCKKNKVSLMNALIISFFLFNFFPIEITL